MNRVILEQIVLAELRGGLWHTTHPDRFSRILASGAILPEPDIPDGDRWKASKGKEYYPYVRTLGGVSLFDFDEFEPESYSEKYPLSSWYEFVPYRENWGSSVWIEIDREQVAPRLISLSNLVVRWKSEGASYHAIMPYIEVAHLGPLPRTAFKRAFVIGDGDSQVRALDLG